MELALHCLHYCQGNTMVIFITHSMSICVYIIFIYSFTLHLFHHFHHASIHDYFPAPAITHSLILFVIYSFHCFFSFTFNLISSHQNVSFVTFP